jgi:hypothetical protein
MFEPVLCLKCDPPCLPALCTEPGDHEERRLTTLLLIAACAGSAACVEELVTRCGSDARGPQNSHGDTAMHAAAGEGFTHVVELLLDRYGADAAALDNDGDTPLAWACEAGQADMAAFLVRLRPETANLANSVRSLQRRGAPPGLERARRPARHPASLCTMWPFPCVPCIYPLCVGCAVRAAAAAPCSVVLLGRNRGHACGGVRRGCRRRYRLHGLLLGHRGGGEQRTPGGVLPGAWFQHCAARRGRWERGGYLCLACVQPVAGVCRVDSSTTHWHFPPPYGACCCTAPSLQSQVPIPPHAVPSRTETHRCILPPSREILKLCPCCWKPTPPWMCETSRATRRFLLPCVMGVWRLCV